MTQLATIEEGKFSAEVFYDGKHVVVRLAGNADANAKPHLGMLFGNVHEHAQHHGVDRVRVDMRQLMFMNSSCFKDLISWLDKLRDVKAPGYHITFLSSNALHWQRRSLHALSCFARGIVTIESGP
jgi:hypothetical protein